MRIAILPAVALQLLLLACGCDIIAGGKLEGAVVKALREDPRTSQFSFEVSAQENDTILITGEVLTEADKEAVTEIAMSVSGVKKVLNNCAVPEPPSELMQDPVVNSPFL